jgi:hypothetical protein
MVTGPIRFVLVDTNCFLRLYQSPVIPLLGQDIGGFRLLTLACLIDEFLGNPNLVKSYRWVTDRPVIDDLLRAKLKLSGINQRKVQADRRELKLFADVFLREHSRKHRLVPPKSLSSRDLELLGTAIVLKGIVATDEWPLRLVCEDLMGDPDYPIGTMNSLDVLSLLESHGKLSADDRRQTVDSWVRLREKLPRGWKDQYQLLFGEDAGSLGAV